MDVSYGWEGGGGSGKFLSKIQGPNVRNQSSWYEITLIEVVVDFWKKNLCNKLKWKSSILKRIVSINFSLVFEIRPLSFVFQIIINFSIVWFAKVKSHFSNESSTQ